MSLFLYNIARCGKPVTIEDRDQRPVNNKNTEVFTPLFDTRAIVSTLRGVKVFDEVNIERVATHKICVPGFLSIPIDSAVEAGLVVTATTTQPHGLTSGEVISLTGAFEASYNMVNVPVTVIDPNTFTYPTTVDSMGQPMTGSLTANQPVSVSAQNWVRFKGKHLKILNVENCCEEDEVFILMCTERGVDTKNANQA